MFGKRVMIRTLILYSLSVRVQTTINHISICFLPQYQRERNRLSLERELKNSLRDTFTPAVWYGLLFSSNNVIKKISVVLMSNVML